MTPVETILLLWLHCSYNPLQNYTHAHANSPAVRQAYAKFQAAGLARLDISFSDLMLAREGSYLKMAALTDKGRELVKQIAAIKIDFKLES